MFLCGLPLAFSPFLCHVHTHIHFSVFTSLLLVVVVVSVPRCRVYSLC